MVCPVCVVLGTLNNMNPADDKDIVDPSEDNAVKYVNSNPGIAPDNVCVGEPLNTHDNVLVLLYDPKLEFPVSTSNIDD